MKRRVGFAVVGALVAIGLVASGYLVHRTLELSRPSAPGAIDVCSAVFGASCDATLEQPSSWFLGVPVAGWGAVYFSVLGSLLLLAWYLRERFAREAVAAALAIGSFGVLTSVWLSIRLVTGDAPPCPLCFVVHAANVALWALLWGVGGVSIGYLTGSARGATRYLFGRKGGEGDTPWKVVAFAAAFLVGTLVYQWVYVETAIRRGPEEEGVEPEEVVRAHFARPVHDLRVTSSDPHLGSLDAPVRLVVFSSLRCPGCRQLMPVLQRLTEKNEGRICLVFKHFPLSPTCNRVLERERHPLSCEAAWATEAAHQQDRFWPYHDAVLALDQGGFAERLGPTAGASGLDPERLARDRAGPAVRRKVSDDIDLGIELGVDATPSVYLNGRRVEPLTIPVLGLLLRESLSRAGTSR